MVKGRARAVVVATGMATELGKIAEGRSSLAHVQQSSVISSCISAMDREEKRKETGMAYYWYRTKVALGVAGTTPLQIKWGFCLWIFERLF